MRSCECSSNRKCFWRIAPRSATAPLPSSASYPSSLKNGFINLAATSLPSSYTKMSSSVRRSGSCPCCLRKTRPQTRSASIFCNVLLDNGVALARKVGSVWVGLRRSTQVWTTTEQRLLAWSAWESSSWTTCAHRHCLNLLSCTTNCWCCSAECARTSRTSSSPSPYSPQPCPQSLPFALLPIQRYYQQAHTQYPTAPSLKPASLSESSQLPSDCWSVGQLQTRMGVLWALVVAVALVGAGAVERMDENDQLMRFHEENSHFPIVHVFHNRHFSSSIQYQDFLEVLEETEARTADYARFVETDCERFAPGEAAGCDEMRGGRDNRAILGYFPVGRFLRYAGKRLQDPPGHRRLNHQSDVFAVHEMEAFVDEMIPNFFEEIGSAQQYQEWLAVRHTPKLLFASREQLEDVPLVLKRLAVHFFLRFDFGFLSDLTSEVAAELNITAFPQLLVLEYNYEKGIYEATEWPETDFSTREYLPLRDFLTPFARASPRNDLLFHKMGVLPDQGVVEVTSAASLDRALDLTSGWAIVSTITGEPLQLKMMRERFGRFFEYIHLRSGNETEEVRMYDPENQRLLPLPGGEIRFKALGKDDFIKAMGAWLRRGFVVAGVREQYGHFCAIAQHTLFRGLAHCIIVKEDDYEATSTALKMEFEIGFGCYQTAQDAKENIAGRNFATTDYENVFESLEYLTRLKANEIVDNFMEKPIKPVPNNSSLADLCTGRRCAFLLRPAGRTDRTAHDYLREVASSFINDFLFYEVDLSCNAELVEVAKGSALLVYHSSADKYLPMKAKLSKSTFQKFLKANLADPAKLPLRLLPTAALRFHDCTVSTAQQQEL